MLNMAKFLTKHIYIYVYILVINWGTQELMIVFIFLVSVHDILNFTRIKPILKKIPHNLH